MNSFYRPFKLCEYSDVEYDSLDKNDINKIDELILGQPECSITKNIITCGVLSSSASISKPSVEYSFVFKGRNIKFPNMIFEPEKINNPQSDLHGGVKYISYRVTIEKLIDEYFMVYIITNRFETDYNPRNKSVISIIIADQIDGLLKLLDDIFYVSELKLTHKSLIELEKYKFAYKE